MYALKELRNKDIKQKEKIIKFYENIFMDNDGKRFFSLLTAFLKEELPPKPINIDLEKILFHTLKGGEGMWEQKVLISLSGYAAVKPRQYHQAR